MWICFYCITGARLCLLLFSFMENWKFIFCRNHTRTHRHKQDIFHCGRTNDSINLNIQYFILILCTLNLPLISLLNLSVSQMLCVGVHVCKRIFLLLFWMWFDLNHIDPFLLRFFIDLKSNPLIESECNKTKNKHHTFWIYIVLIGLSKKKKRLSWPNLLWIEICINAIKHWYIERDLSKGNISIRKSLWHRMRLVYYY